MPDTADQSGGFGVLGKEGKFIAHGTQKGKGVAVFTSGGDAQGMNAAVRAVVRMGLYLGATVYFIREGYQGMVDGDEFIIQADWTSVSGIIHRGGTVIGSARCKEFRERSGRLKAARNLIKKGITNLVCIGGDGSLTGANQFRKEWGSLVEELFKNGDIDELEKEQFKHLNIVGLVGSIDNDFCGTDMTIGTDSALHRIIEAIDAIVATASSHQRTFIMEVMGRHCGYLALVAAIATEADYVFIPEWPPEINWPDTLCRKLANSRKMGQRLNIIIVAEGATDRENKPITCEQIRKVVVDRLQQDTRITILGHIQRGGVPSAFDRILGTRMGAEAVLALFDMKPDSDAVVVTLDGNQAVRVPLMYCVEKTKAVGKALSEQQWERAIELRGKSFARNLETYRLLGRIKPPDRASLREGSHKYGVMHVGTPTSGMNAVVRSVVRNAQYRGDIIYGIHDGFDGFVTENFHVINWSDVNGWIGEGGAFLGSTRTLPDKFLSKVASNTKKFGLHGLIVIGGFEAYRAVQILAENRTKYPEFKIPLVVIPSTVSNNVPGTDLTVGCDSSLDEICKLCDIIRQSAQGVKRRVFVIETAGTSGYLCTMAALASGADAAYIMEEPIRIRNLQEDVMHLATKMNEGVMCGFVLRNHNASHQYNTDFLFRLYSEEGKNIFTTRMNIFGHLQSGGSPSPFDRNMATKMGAKAIGWLSRKLDEVRKGDIINADQPGSAILIGVTKRRWVFTPVQELKEITDYTNRLPRNQWWMKLRPLLRIMAKHNAIFEEDVDTVTAVTDDNFSDIGNI